MTFQRISETYPLVLASASPRRKRLLGQIGLPFRALTSHIDEDHPLGNPVSTTQRLAEGKAEAVHSRLHQHWILGADTVVVLGNTMLGKPRDFADAQSMLLSLSGKNHRVITGFCLLDPSGQRAHCEAVITRVHMKKLGEKEITAYIATGEPFGKAGGYAIQGVGAFMIEEIFGSYTNVVGLPVCALIKALLKTGALENFPLPAFAAVSRQE
jgi:septum formation protein